MADKAKQDKIDSFVKITGVDEDRAKFYMESSGWNLELAMGSFYEEDPEDDGLMAVGESRREAQTTSQSPTMTSSSGGKNLKKKSPKKTANSRFATIGSMNAGDDDSSEDEGQAFYAGGSERSGQQVLGPKKKKTIVAEDLFRSAREHGAEELHDEEAQPTRGAAPFKGSGYRLGDTDGTESEKIHGEPMGRHKKEFDCVLKLWKNGFSVGDGPLRDFKDPANQEFLAAISKGQVPHELIRAAQGGEVNLNMEDHRDEDYVKPKVVTKAFTGEGNTLGSPAPTVVSHTASATASPASQSNLKIDETKPTTTLQLRLADGSRLVQKFNLTHTVSDIRQHIISSRPQYTAANFVLQTTFPNKELTNESESVETAKLQNAVVVQKMK